MNTLNPMQFFVFSIALGLYNFTNHRLTRLLYQNTNYRRWMEFVVFTGCFVIDETILYAVLAHDMEKWIVPGIFLHILCQFGIFFLYKRSWIQNLWNLLKLFGGECLFTALWILRNNGVDWEFLILLVIGLKLFLTLLLETTMRHREKERLSYQVQMYQHQMEIMEQSQEQIRFLRHDMKNHILHMKHLLISDDYEGLQDYMQETASHLEISQEFVHSGNRDIDSLLNYKLLAASQNGTEIMTDIKIPADLQIPPFDLNVILGNLLDNALEALKACADRKLIVSLRYDKGILYILVQNTCAQEPLPFSIKGAGHGLGLKSVQRTLEHYHGELKTDYQDHVFTAAVLLYLT